MNRKQASILLDYIAELEGLDEDAGYPVITEFSRGERETILDAINALTEIELGLAITKDAKKYGAGRRKP